MVERDANTVRLEIDGAVARLTFARPHVLNAGNARWVAELGEATETLAGAQGVRVVVMSGEGRAFSTGVDRLASDAALLGLPAVKECLIPSMSLYRLPRLIGLARAKQLIMLGQPITAAEAERFGLVNRVVTAEEFKEALEDTVARFLALPGTSVIASKRLTSRAFDLGFDDFRGEMEAAFRQCLASPEHTAAMQALQDRKRTRSLRPGSPAAMDQRGE